MQILKSKVITEELAEVNQDNRDYLTALSIK